jgi:hypothetical protein
MVLVVGSEMIETDNRLHNKLEIGCYGMKNIQKKVIELNCNDEVNGECVKSFTKYIPLVTTHSMT